MRSCRELEESEQARLQLQSQLQTAQQPAAQAGSAEASKQLREAEAKLQALQQVRYAAASSLVHAVHVSCMCILSGCGVSSHLRLHSSRPMYSIAHATCTFGILLFSHVEDLTAPIWPAGPAGVSGRGAGPAAAAGRRRGRGRLSAAAAAGCGGRPRAPAAAGRPGHGGPAGRPAARLHR